MCALFIRFLYLDCVLYVLYPYRSNLLCLIQVSYTAELYTNTNININTTNTSVGSPVNHGCVTVHLITPVSPSTAPCNTHTSCPDLLPNATHYFTLLVKHQVVKYLQSMKFRFYFYLSARCLSSSGLEPFFHFFFVKMMNDKIIYCFFININKK